MSLNEAEEENGSRISFTMIFDLPSNPEFSGQITVDCTTIIGRAINSGAGMGSPPPPDPPGVAGWFACYLFIPFKDPTLTALLPKAAAHAAA